MDGWIVGCVSLRLDVRGYVGVIAFSITDI